MYIHVSESCLHDMFLNMSCVTSSVTSGQFSDSDLSSVLLSVMLCMSRSLDRPAALFPIFENGKCSSLCKWKDKDNGQEEFPRPGTQSGAQMAKCSNEQAHGNADDFMIVVILLLTICKERQH